MSLFKKKIHSLSEYPEYKDRLTSFVGECSYFSVGLIQSYFKLSLAKRKRLAIYQNVLDKFIPLAEGFYIYNLNCEAHEVRHLAKFLAKDHTRHKIIFDERGWNRFDTLLYRPAAKGSICELRGGIVGRCRLDDAILKSIFEYCCNPNVIENIEVGCGKNELHLARNSPEKGMFYVIIEKINHGLQSITLAAGKKDIHHIFDLASRYCKITSNYRKYYIEVPGSLTIAKK